MSSADAIELRIPADAAYLSVARMFAGSVAKTFELDPERTEDLRLALSEICAATVEAGSDGAAAVSIDVAWDDAAVRFTCPGVAMAEDAPRWVLVRSLIPDVRSDGDGAITFSIER